MFSTFVGLGRLISCQRPDSITMASDRTRLFTIGEIQDHAAIELCSSMIGHTFSLAGVV